MMHKKLRETTLQLPVLGEIEFTLPARHGQKERAVTQTLQVISEKNNATEHDKNGSSANNNYCNIGKRD